MEGWILLHRKLQESDIWVGKEPFDMRSAWVDLLLMANHEDVKTIFDYKPFIVKRGQCLTSVRKLCLRWGWGNEKTLRYLRMLESLGMIKKDSNNRRTLLTIENYDVYQTLPNSKRTRKEHSPNTDRTVTERSPNTEPPQTMNEMNEKNEMNSMNENKYYPNDDILDKAFSDYVAMRKQIKKPMTDRAIELSIKRLDTLSGGDNDKAIKILEQSIIHSWQGLFELKEGTKTQTIDWSKV